MRGRLKGGPRDRRRETTQKRRKVKDWRKPNPPVKEKNRKKRTRDKRKARDKEF